MWTYRATVVRVVDGDTLDLDIDLGIDVHIDQRVRLRGIDAPELRTAKGKDARAYVDAWVNLYAPVTVTTTQTKAGSDEREKYGRLLADITAGGLDLATDLVAHDLATPWDGTGKRPA